MNGSILGEYIQLDCCVMNNGVQKEREKEGRRECACVCERERKRERSVHPYCALRYMAGFNGVQSC